MDLENVIGTLAAVVSAWVAVQQYLDKKKAGTQRSAGNVGRQPRIKQYQTALLLSVMITGLLIGVVRPVGMLQEWELLAFDQLLRLRPHEEPDRRLLIVTVTEEDLQYQDRMGMERKAASISDQALTRVLQKLDQHQPRVIGLDI